MDVPGASISPARLNGPSCHYAHSWPLVPTRTSMAPRVTTHVPGPMHARLWRVVPARISPACTHCPLILARTSLALWRLDPARMFPECTHSTSVPPLLSSSTHEPGLWVQHAGPWSLTLPLVSAGCQCAASSQHAQDHVPCCSCEQFQVQVAVAGSSCQSSSARGTGQPRGASRACQCASSRSVTKGPPALHHGPSRLEERHQLPSRLRPSRHQGRGASPTALPLLLGVTLGCKLPTQRGSWLLTRAAILGKAQCSMLPPGAWGTAYPPFSTFLDHAFI